MNHLMKLSSGIQWRSADLLCPNCGTCSMSVFLQCDGRDQECLTVASCRQCRKKYDAEVLPTYGERHEALLERAEREPCPLCAGHRRIVRSLCDRMARECFFLLACGECGDVRLA